MLCLVLQVFLMTTAKGNINTFLAMMNTSCTKRMVPVYKVKDEPVGFGFAALETFNNFLFVDVWVESHQESP